MNNYNEFKAIDFVNDQAFRAWIFNKKPPISHDLYTWLEQNPMLNREAQIAKLYLQHIQQGLPTIAETDLEEKIDAFRKAAENRQNSTEEGGEVKKFNWIRISGVAASIVLVLGLAFFYLNRNNPSADELLSVLSNATATGDNIQKTNNTHSTIEIVLPDSSKVLLEPNSSVAYSKTFDGDIREVNLTGQAFFDVVRNPDKPFIVHFNELVVKVLGTSFTIKAFKNDAKMQVLVKTGKVSVFAKGDWYKVKTTSNSAIGGVIITANQQVEYQKETAQFQKTIVENPNIIDVLTKEDDFVFEDTPLSAVLKKIEQAYGINIVVDQHQIANCTITAELSNEPLLEKLNIICKLIHAKFEMIDGQVIMNVKSCN